jgi:hypothetical protein
VPDRPAPDLAVTQWIAGEAPPSFRALGGRCALLELTDPEDLVCQGLASRTAEAAAAAEARRMVVVTVAVGAGAEEGKAREFARRARVSWPLGLDRRGETWWAAGMPSLPRWILVAPDGRIHREGSPGALDEKDLAAFAERSRLWRPGEVAKALRPAAELFVLGRHGAAGRRAEAALAEVARRRKEGLPVEGTEERDGAVIREAVRACGEERLALAERLEKERWSLEALEIYEGVAAAFGGTETGARARAARERVASDPRANGEMAATRELREAMAGLRPLSRARVERTIRELDRLAVVHGSFRTSERMRAERERLALLLGSL